MGIQFTQGDTAFFVESNWRIREVRILKISGEFATIHFADGEGGTRLRLNRLFKSKEEAEKHGKICRVKNDQIL